MLKTFVAEALDMADIILFFLRVTGISIVAQAEPQF